MKRLSYIVILALIVSGCTAEDYQRQADFQVDKLVKDRQQQTLAYKSQVKADLTAPTELTKKSYAELPTTPLPPQALPPLEVAPRGLEYAPIGPQNLFSGMELPQDEPLSIEEARRPGLERLRLGPTPTASTIPAMDLFGAIEYAVEHGRDYQAQMEDLYLVALDVTLEQHLFEPRPFANTGITYVGGQGRGVDYRSALAITNTVGIRQQLPYGGEITAQALVDFVQALNDGATDGESAQLVLSGTIPLLRGAGKVNLEPLIQSHRDLVYQVRDFEEFRRQYVVQIASQYFRLLTSQQAIINRRFNYIVSAQLTEQSYAVYAAGRPGTNFLSVQRAQQQLFTAENDIITAEDSYQAALDDFKVLIGMPVEQPLDIVPVALDVNPPDLEQDVISLALKYRLDLQTASDRIEDSRRQLAVAKNRLLPDLELTGRTSIGNDEDDPLIRIDGRTLDYSLGLNLDYPIDRLSERNAMRRAQISLERAQRNWQETRDSIISQVRDAVRSIRSARSTLEIQQRSIELARKRLDYANELLVLGRANDSRDSVDAQNELLRAQDRYDQARANYQTQILNFLRDTGTLRVSPDAGALGLAMDRAAQMRNLTATK